MKNNAGVEDILRQRLSEVRSIIEAREKELNPLQEEEKKLVRMLHEYTSGSMGSGDVTDEQIVRWLNDNAQENIPKLTVDVAAAFGRDGRGFSKRLLRMERDGMIAGSPEGGYYIAQTGQVGRDNEPEDPSPAPRRRARQTRVRSSPRT